MSNPETNPAFDYNATLNLPQTEFPMRANLPQREPEMLKKWQEDRIYYKLQEKNKGKPVYILHDGPPYANGDIHCGTALNKTLKDIIVKYKTLQGYRAPFVPGWDAHGLPVELQAMKTLKSSNKDMGPVEVRRFCREYSNGMIERQKQQFIRLGVWGNFDKPYITTTDDYVARQIEVFGRMALNGYIYKGLKPVYWCADCHTALAEAEIEYADDRCTSIYVKFPVVDDRGMFSGLCGDLKVFFVIWTTTTWTLPANVAICLGPNYMYSLVKAGGECYVIAGELVEKTMQAAGIEDYSILGAFKGSELEMMRAAHPFLDRESLVITGDHVTLESGTGCVHTAPGHGVDDYNVTRRYDLPIIVPVDDRGRMTEEAGRSAGLKTDAANAVILEQVAENGLLLASAEMEHQYPHCWRCHKPVLFRATSQWFCSVSDFKDKALEAIEGVKFSPAWGKERLSSMVADRNDWCISRQRVWGVPIPMFYCRDCGRPYISETSVKAVADMFRAEGSDQWYVKPAEEILSAGEKCPECGCEGFEKETNIMDVWFDSGCSHDYVLESWPELSWPADMYLEGGDQHRGWFQSSLLTAVATRGRAPYSEIVTCGWTVDGEGRAMHKSLGNSIAPEEIIKDYGADVLRLWAASADYQNDMRVSSAIFKQLSEAYRKIRNTARFILGNIFDFDPDGDYSASYSPLDRWALARLNALIAETKAAYDEHEFYVVYHALYNFCVVDMSNIYLDIVKDRLYVERADSGTRRAVQAVIHRVLEAITLIMSPILAFTSDEIWASMPHRKEIDRTSPIFNDYPAQADAGLSDAESGELSMLFEIREAVKKELENAREQKLIGASLEACVDLVLDDRYAAVADKADVLKEMCIVSGLSMRSGEKFSVKIEKAAGAKCVRCWTYSDFVGSDPVHPQLCRRCAEIVKS